MRIPWPFRQKLETRSDSSYTDALVQAILSRASGNTSALPTATGALETAAGFVQRAFASAELEARDTLRPGLTPEVLGMIGRALIRRGEYVAKIETEGGRFRLLPADSHDVEGGPDPAGWEYRVTVGGPERTKTYPYLPATAVVHIRYAVDAAKPWLGLGPLGVAQLAGKLSAETSKALADEATSPRGQLLGIPVDGDDATVDSFKSDLKKAVGDLLLLEGGDWGGAAGGGTVDAQAKRFGPMPPAALIEQLSEARKEVLAACGLSTALWDASNAQAAREAYRQALVSVIQPLGKLVVTELRDKLEDDTLALDWTELRAADIAGRARAFQSMVNGGMEVERAVALAGLMAGDG